MTTEILTSHGFAYHSKCTCDGVYTEKYKNGEWEVRWRRWKYTFKLKKGHTSLTTWLPIDQLNAILEKEIKIVLS